MLEVLGQGVHALRIVDMRHGLEHILLQHSNKQGGKVVHMKVAILKLSNAKIYQRARRQVRVQGHFLHGLVVALGVAEGQRIVRI